MSSYDSTIRSEDMDPETRKLVRAILPKVPLIARVVLMHTLSLSTPSQYLNLRSELIVAVLRSFLQPSSPRSITSTQKLTLRDPGIKGRIWVAKTSSPSVDAIDADALLSSVRGAIDAMLEPGAPRPVEPGFAMPDVVPVEAEWTGFRSSATADSVLPDISEEEKFGQLMKETTTATTVLYFHGGAYYLLDPCTHRPTTSRLARMTGGRVYSVRYRLAPQHPFPSALVDALVSYLTLLYPPEGSFHDRVDPGHIVFAGDSAGGNLCLALLQLLLQLRRQGRQGQGDADDSTGHATIRWQGKEVDLPLPAGVAANSPWLDITQSSPSWEDPDTHMFDYLPPPPSYQRHRASPPPACAAWPATPPRANMYAPDTLLSHPLVSLVMARSWAGAPSVWMCTGWEMLAAEDRWFARKLEREGVAVVLEQYEAMPHCFAMVLEGIKEGKRCFEGWAGFIRQVTGQSSASEEKKGEVAPDDAQLRGDEDGKRGVESRFVTVKAKTLREVEIPVDDLTTTSEEEMRERVWRRAGDLVPGLSREKGAKL